MSHMDKKGTHTTFMQESYIQCIIWIAVASSKGIYIIYCKQQIELKEKIGSQNSPLLIPKKINIFKKTKTNTDSHQKPLKREKATVSLDKLQRVLDKVPFHWHVLSNSMPSFFMMPSRLKKSTIQTNAKKQHASNFFAS